MIEKLKVEIPIKLTLVLKTIDSNSYSILITSEGVHNKMKIMKIRNQLDCQKYRFPPSLTHVNVQRRVVEKKDSHYV